MRQRVRGRRTHGMPDRCPPTAAAVGLRMEAAHIFALDLASRYAVPKGQQHVKSTGVLEVAG